MVAQFRDGTVKVDPLKSEWLDVVIKQTLSFSAKQQTMTLDCHFGLRTFYAFSMFSKRRAIYTQHKALLVKHRSLFLVNWIIIFCFKSTAFWGISLYSPVEWGSRLNLAPYFFPVLLGFFEGGEPTSLFFSPGGVASSRLCRCAGSHSSKLSTLRT